MRAYVHTRTMLGFALAGLRQRLSREEHGAQTVEWVGVGGVAGALAAAVALAVGGLGDEIVEAIQALLEQLGIGVGFPDVPAPYEPGGINDIPGGPPGNCPGGVC